MEDSLIKVEGVGKSYGKKKVLYDVSFEVKPGEILGLIGASGSGKTTMLNILIGYVVPDVGDVKYKQPQLVDSSNSIYKSVYKQQSVFKNIYGFAAQVPSFYEKLTVKENLIYFGELYDLSYDTLKANVDTLLKLTDLEVSSYILGKNLSGGMERRLDMACALIHNPQVLILDEPTSDLDPVLRKNVNDLIKKINNKGTTVVISSHHLNELEILCDRIAIIKEGTIMAIGTPEELKAKFLKHHEIIIESHPGNYEELGCYLQKKFGDEIIRFEHNDSGLILTCKDHQNLLNALVKAIEFQKEKLIELKLVKPSLNQVFINISKAGYGKDEKEHKEHKHHDRKAHKDQDDKNKSKDTDNKDKNKDDKSKDDNDKSKDADNKDKDKDKSKSKGVDK